MATSESPSFHALVEGIFYGTVFDLAVASILAVVFATSHPGLGFLAFAAVMVLGMFLIGGLQSDDANADDDADLRGFFGVLGFAVGISAGVILVPVYLMLRWATRSTA